FLVNRSTSEPAAITIDVRDLGVNRVTETQLLHDDDVYAKNTLAQQQRVRLRAIEDVTLDGGILTVTLPPVSWAAVGQERSGPSHGPRAGRALAGNPTRAGSEDWGHADGS